MTWRSSLGIVLSALLGAVAGCGGGGGGGDGGGDVGFGGSSGLPGTHSTSGPGLVETPPDDGFPRQSGDPEQGLPGVQSASAGGDFDDFGGGDLGGTGSGGASSGVNKGARLDSLSPSEQDALCESTLEFLQELLGSPGAGRIDCVIEGLSEAQFAGPEDDPIEICEDVERNCDPGDFGGGFEPGNCDFDLGDECDATVGDLEQCMQDSLDVLDQAYSAISCDFAGDPGALSGLEPSQPASCAYLDAVCPGADAGDISNF